MATLVCPCGNHGNPSQACRCGPIQIENYVGKISGPLLDRIAIHTVVHPVDVDALDSGKRGTDSTAMRARVEDARRRQAGRVNGTSVLNAALTESDMRRTCTMEPKAAELLVGAQKRLRFSARARAHIVRVSRTIADLAGADRIGADHVAEAIQYRSR